MQSILFNRFLLAATILLFWSGCKKDLGNYTYNEINELTEISGIPKEVVAVYGKPLLVDPVLKFSLDPSFDERKYDYEWTYIASNGLGGTALFQLATTRQLNIQTKVVAGTYTAYYNVTDKVSGVKYFHQFKLKVVNEINEGWLLMCDVNGQARVDMLSLNGSGQFELIKDLLASTGSELKLEGKPVMTYTYAPGLLIGPDAISYGLYFGTDKGTTKVEPNTFKWTKTMGLTYEMFGDIPNGFHADVIKQASAGSSYMIGHENAYYYYRALNIYYSAPINYITSEQRSFKVAPFIGSDHLSNSFAIFYDSTNRRFVKHSSGGATSTVIPEQPADMRKFMFSTGMDLLYMQWVGFNGGEIFAILKEPTGQKRFLARFNPRSNVQSYYDEITGTDFSQADYYAISPDLGYVFYSVGGKVYEYDMVYKTSKLMKDYGNRKVTYLAFHEFKSYIKYPHSNRLMVATSSPELPVGAEGTIDIFTVPPVNGDLILENTFSGFGKVKSLTYRER